MWRDSVTSWQMAIADRLLRSMPFSDFSFGPLPHPPVHTVSPSGHPWDQVTSRIVNWDEEGIEAELESFSKRVNFREVIREMEEQTWDCRCGGFFRRSGACTHRCGRARRNCPAGLGRFRFSERRVKCSECFDAWGYRFSEQSEDGFFLDEPGFCGHGDSLVLDSWFACECHGTLDTPRGLRDAATEESLLSCHRPRLTYVRQRPEDSARRRTPSIVTWQGRSVEKADPLLCPWKIRLPALAAGDF